jgi:nicotianamine synthase
MSHSFITKVKQVVGDLDRLPSLEPSRVVNRYFSQLVGIVTHSSLIDVDTSEMVDLETTIPLSRRLCAQGETLLERYWAKRFIALPGLSYDRLKLFPYFENYEQLVLMEINTIQQSTPFKRVTFLGGGPLPLSAIIMAHEYGSYVTVIDSDKEAVAISTKLVSALGLAEYISIVQADAYSYQSTDPVIILGALVGTSPEEKQQLLNHMASTLPVGCLVVARGVDGCGVLLYPPVPIATDLKYIKTVQGPRSIINTVVVFRV